MLLWVTQNLKEQNKISYITDTFLNTFFLSNQKLKINAAPKLITKFAKIINYYIWKQYFKFNHALKSYVKKKKKKKMIAKSF